MFGLKKKLEGNAPSPVRRRIGATVAATLAADPRATRAESDAMVMYRVPDFLDPRACERLIALIEAHRRPSTLLKHTDDTSFRTSDSCDMDRTAPDVRPIDEGIAHLLGLDPPLGETMQGQRYAPGQQFRAHQDYFDGAADYWPAMKASGGQRTWTAMVYLNDVADGGATWFPRAGLRIAPRRGLLIAWNNMAEDGSPNASTVHEGMPVIDGTKYIVTKWFRERPWTP